MPRPIEVNYYVAPDSAALTHRAARHFTELIEGAVERRGRARIAISGGSTPRPVFEALADETQPWRKRIDWARLDIYWVDERCVPPNDKASNYNMTRQALLDRVPLPAAQVHRMEGELEPELAASRYEAELRNSMRLEGAEAPRFDVIQLGIGPDGHTASLFPHTAALTEFGRIVVANHTGAEQAWRLTLTAPVINQGPEVFFLISGKDKAAVLKDVLLGERDPEQWPSQLIRPAGGILTLLLDQDAAAMLPAPNADGRGQLTVE